MDLRDRGRNAKTCWHMDSRMTELTIVPGKNSLSLWRDLAADGGPVALAKEAWPSIERSRGHVESALASGRAIYGVNTGFGRLAQTRIPAAELKLLQRNLVLSHAAGVGELLPANVVRLTLALKIASLALGWVGEETMAEILGPIFQRLLGSFSAVAAHTASIVLAYVLITYMHVVLGEYVPKTMAFQIADRAALWLARPLLLFVWIAR